VAAAARPQGNHDPAKPASCADTVLDQPARNLEQAIAREQDTRAPTELGRCQAKVGIHCQRGKADTCAIDIIEDEGQGQDGNKAPGILAQSAGSKCLDVGRGYFDDPRSGLCYSTHGN
jgi:hypothetical protein